MAAFETMHRLKAYIGKKKALLALKLDMNKTYDQVE